MIKIERRKNSGIKSVNLNEKKSWGILTHDCLNRNLG